MLRALACSLVLFAACGDDSGSTLDAGRPDTPGGNIDAAQSECDYTEQSDLTNDTTGSGTAETSGVTFGTSPIVVCGTFEHTHFDGDITVDVDAFTFTVAAETDVLLRLVGAGATAIYYVGVDIYPAGSSSPITSATFYGDHGVSSARLPAGTYELLPFALDVEAPIASVPYQIEITSDVPDTRCAAVTTGGYTESANANDVVTIPMGSPPALTGVSDDNPEPTSFVIAPNFSIRATGEAADIGSPDQYEDKDTYLISTGSGTNELTVRIDWTTAGANLDWILFEQNNVEPITRSLSTAADLEMKLTAVKPNTDYWLMVGARATTTVPAPYNLTLCGAQFTP
jgi:hypothetical protein